MSTAGPVRLSAVEAVQAELRLGGASDARARAEQEAVRREILRREAERLGVAADPDQVESRRDAMVEQAGGEEALSAALAQVPITDAQLRSGLEDGVLYQAVQDARFADLSATSAEARAYYEKHRESFREQGSLHLFSIRVAAERIAENALERLRQGRPFAEVARQFSTDPEAKAAGGDMGVVALASLPASFRDALEPASPGEVVGPVQGPGGWYLLKATDVKKDARRAVRRGARRPRGGADAARALPRAREVAGRRARAGVGDAALTPPSPRGRRACCYTPRDRDYRRSLVRNALILLAVVALVILACGCPEQRDGLRDRLRGRHHEPGLAVLGVAGDRGHRLRRRAGGGLVRARGGGRRPAQARGRAAVHLRAAARDRAGGRGGEGCGRRRRRGAAAEATPEIVEATVVAEREESTVVVAEAVTVVVDEAETVVAEDVPCGRAAGRRRTSGPAEVEHAESAGEQTAVTMVAPATEPAEAAETGDGEERAEPRRRRPRRRRGRRRRAAGRRSRGDRRRRQARDPAGGGIRRLRTLHSVT